MKFGLPWREFIIPNTTLWQLFVYDPSGVQIELTFDSDNGAGAARADRAGERLHARRELLRRSELPEALIGTICTNDRQHRQWALRAGSVTFLEQRARSIRRLSTQSSGTSLANPPRRSAAPGSDTDV